MTPTERITALRRIVADSQYETLDGQMIDLFSASAAVQIYDALNEKNKALFASMPAANMCLMAFKLAGQEARWKRTML